MEKCDDRQSCLQNKIEVLTQEIAAGKKKEAALKSELERDKRYYMNKEKQSLHTINRLTNENQRLKEMFGKDISKGVFTRYFVSQNNFFF